jgi:hypothetical protein
VYPNTFPTFGHRHLLLTYPELLSFSKMQQYMKGHFAKPAYATHGPWIFEKFAIIRVDRKIRLFIGYLSAAPVLVDVNLGIKPQSDTKSSPIWAPRCSRNLQKVNLLLSKRLEHIPITGVFKHLASTQILSNTNPVP